MGDLSSNPCFVACFQVQWQKNLLGFHGFLKRGEYPVLRNTIGALHAASSYMEVQKENQINLLSSESLLKKAACRNAYFKQCLHCSAGTSETFGVIGERVVGCK